MASATTPSRGRFHSQSSQTCDHETELDLNGSAHILEQRHLDYLCGIPFHTPSELIESSDEQQVKLQGLAIDQQRRQQHAQRLAQKEMLRATLVQRITAQTEAKLTELLTGDWPVVLQQLPINPKLTESLAMLALDAPTSHLEQQLRQLSWLTRELLATVNSPLFKQSHAITTPIVDLPHALASFGQERLKQLLARHLCEQMLPDDNRPFANSARRLWQHALVSANAAHYLAEKQGLDPYLAGRLSWVNSYGSLTLLRLIKQIFLALCEHHMQQARLTAKPEIHQVLSELDLPATMLKRQFSRYQKVITKALLPQISPECKTCVTVSRELHSSLPWKLTSPYARIVKFASCYSQYLCLNEQRRIQLDEAVKLMAQYGFSGDDLQELTRQNLKKARA
ncbi:HDOD domain-containing protein [Corallincola holothuriorum]|uniref:HDOD domain-containing protein n=1 Tax=Corallincola holothuriorum TaxID=2282215 RepID=A0A368N3C5_9GAMM|nr:HDOD domain-containing protein [Corallincola holothuriorum]RCU45067.1 HDOD domain-containing protein [Corallincola holothuriorum]